MLTIRKMQESDLPEITQIERECFGGEAWSREDFYYRLTNGAFVNLTALWDNEIAGYITVTALSEASVDSIAVAPRFRRLKIASRLLGHALSGSFDRVFLEVRESNLPARALYKSAGFSEIGIRKDYYDDPSEDAVIMLRIATAASKKHEVIK